MRLQKNSATWILEADIEETVARAPGLIWIYESFSDYILCTTFLMRRTQSCSDLANIAPTPRKVSPVWRTCHRPSSFSVDAMLNDSAVRTVGTVPIATTEGSAGCMTWVI